jgi:hypothetical protein
MNGVAGRHGCRVNDAAAVQGSKAEDGDDEDVNLRERNSMDYILKMFNTRSGNEHSSM